MTIIEVARLGWNQEEVGVGNAAAACMSGHELRLVLLHDSLCHIVSELEERFRFFRVQSISEDDMALEDDQAVPFGERVYVEEGQRELVLSHPVSVRSTLHYVAEDASWLVFSISLSIC